MQPNQVRYSAECCISFLVQIMTLAAHLYLSQQNIIISQSKLLLLFYTIAQVQYNSNPLVESLFHKIMVQNLIKFSSDNFNYLTRNNSDNIFTFVSISDFKSWEFLFFPTPFSLLLLKLFFLLNFFISNLY